jgi:murein DD-endopeptidase MepM/ murein hydrolase activator NlpD
VRGTVAGVLLLASLAFGLPVAGAAQSDVDRARARANAAAAALAAAQTRLASVQRDLAVIEAKRQEAEQRAAALRAVVRSSAISQFMRSTVGLQSLALDPGDASALARARALRSLVVARATDSMDAYRVAADELRADEVRAGALRSAASSALSAYRKRAADAAAELRRLVAIDKERVAAAAAARRAAARAVPVSKPGAPTVIGNGSWICPVQGPHAFSDDYGDARAGGRRHAGNDILAPRGTPVVAPVAGTARQHDNRLGGHAFYLYGADGTTYYGAHLDSYTGNYGSVGAGTVLGYVGNTGDAAGGPTHLHFEIHPGGGRDIDPYPTLRRYC